MTSHEYFIQNYLKIIKADDSLSTFELSDCDTAFLKMVEDAEKSGATLKMLKGRTGARFVFVKDKAPRRTEP